MSETLKKVGNYKFIRKIGAGATSEVFEGRKEDKLQRYAIKMIKIKAMSKEQRQMIEKQVLIIKGIDHPHIVKLHETLATANHYYLIFEFCQKGDLEKYLKQNLGTLLSLDNVRKIIRCIGQAVQHLHSMGIAHRDIKLANVLLKKDLTIKLADFGFAKQQQNEEVMMKTYCGTPITMAPEILKGKPYDKKCDIWSLGVILFQLTFGKLPFPIDQGYAVFIEKVTTEKVKIPSNPQIPDSLKELIYGCLETNQIDRYSIDQFMNNKWMLEENQFQLSQQKMVQSVNEILQKVAKQSKKIEYRIEQQIEENQSISIFQRLLSCRICDIVTGELNKVFDRQVELRKNISGLIDDNKELKQTLDYYDNQMLKKFKDKDIKIRFIGQSDVFLPISSLKSIKFPKPLNQSKIEPVQMGPILMEYLKKLATVNMQLQQKKKRYHLVINFLDFVHNFQLEVTIFFNNNYEVDFSLQKLADYIKDGNINEEDEKDYHKGLNHITIALECKEKDQKFRDVANSLKVNCQKRIDDIQREINGY